jgi:hypothetical protein
MLCMLLVLATSDFRWFRRKPAACDGVALMHANVYPLSLLDRQHLLKQIEITPTLDDDPTVGLPTPDHADIADGAVCWLTQPSPRELDRSADPLYGFMSLQR